MELNENIAKKQRTCPEVDDEVEKKDCVWETVEDDPFRAQIIVEEGDGHGKDDQVGDQKHQHEQVPVESKQSFCCIKEF